MKLSDRALGNLHDWMARPQTGDVVVDRFELRQRIGEGGMSTVYAALDRTTQRIVAVKVLTGDGEHDRARFEREVHALKTLVHPGVVRLLAHGLHDGTCYIAMERLEGCNLAERLRRGRLSLRDTVDLGARLASVLGAMHAVGVVHRDIKPANVFLRGDLEGSRTSDAYLLDFGLVKAEGAPTLTAIGSIVGTPGYMPPERVRAEDTSDDSSGDVFSLGCVLYECLLGRAPFEAETTQALLARVLVGMAPLVRRERPETPSGLEALVESMLAQEPGNRPSAPEVERRLGAIGADLPESEVIELAPGVVQGAIVAEKYRVDRRLGEGGMGVVVAAHHLELGLDVAIKFLRAGDADEGRLIREARAASRIESEHVARVLDVGRTEAGRPYIVMEHLAGEDLAHRLAAVGRFEVGVAVDYVTQACEAIAEAHALGIVHRDLKPSNVFVAKRRNGSETIKVLDFGISKLTRSLTDASVTHTAEAVVMGSVAYMAPEQLESASRADVRSDIWALGVVLFELVSGVKPFAGESSVAIAARIAAAPAPSLSALAPGVPGALEAVIARCLAKEPKARFQDIPSFVHALSAALQTPAEETAPTRRTKILVASAAALTGVALTLGLTSRAQPEAEPRAPEPVSVRAAEPSSRPTAEPLPPALAASAPSAGPSSATPVAPSSAALARPAAVRPAKPLASASASSRPARSDLDLRDPALEGR